MTATSPAPARGDDWLVDFDPTRGHEQARKRPALILSTDGLNRSAAGVVIVLPLTSKAKHIRSHVRVDPTDAGLKSSSFIKCEDLRSVSTTRLARRWGRVSPTTLRAVEQMVRILLEL
jgi:mRNA interferase MazF